jgi:hypothetical protein
VKLLEKRDLNNKEGNSEFAINEGTESNFLGSPAFTSPSQVIYDLFF